MLIRSLITAACLCAAPLQASSATLKACEQSLDYTVQAPGPEVPEAFRAMSGVWVGKMDTGLCVALIVQSVKADGSAQLIYANGSMTGQYSIKSGNRKLNGKIAGGKLSAANQTASFTFSPRGPADLDFTYTAGSYGPFQGNLKRQ